MSLSFVRQTVVEESLEVELTPEQQAQFDKLDNLQDKATFLDALMDDDTASVKVTGRSEISAVTQLSQTEGERVAVAPAAFTDYLDQKRRESMPLKEHTLRFVAANEDGAMELQSKVFMATSYVEAMEDLFKDALKNGYIIDRVVPSGDSTALPSVIQLDDRVFDLTPLADELGATLIVGAISVNLKRMGNDISLSMTHQVSGEEIDAISISDEDYLKGMEPDGGPSLS